MLNTKLIVIIAAIIQLLIANSAYAQEQFSFKNISGEWKGTLEYADYKTDKRVKMKTKLEVESSKNGESATLKFVYDDFGKIYRDKSKHKINFAKKGYFFDGDKFSFNQAENGKVVLLGSGIENGRKVPYRITLSFDSENLSILKETRTPFQFRNEYKFTRVEKSSAQPKTFSVKQLNEDFGVLKRTLEAVHPGLYRYNTPEELEAKFKKFEAKLNKPLSDGEFFKIVSQMLSEIKCYHTYTNPFNQRKEIKEGLFNRKNYFPFYFQIINRKMIVTDNASSKRISKGSEITKINGVKMSKILTSLLTVTFADGNGTTENRLSSLSTGLFSGTSYSRFDLMFPLFYPPKNGAYKIEAVDFKTKKKMRFEVLAMTKNERAEEMAKRYGNAPTYDDGWLFEIREDSTAYLRVSNFIVWKLSFKYKEFLAKAFNEINAKKVKNLIVDIRGNGGGDSNAPIEILRYIARKEFLCKSGIKTYIKAAKVDGGLFKHFETYDKQIEAGLRNGVPENFYRKADNGLLEFLPSNKNCESYKPFENSFKGKTYLLIDSANSSAAFSMARLAKRYKLATLVGQATGGNKRGFNGGSYLFTYLPNSKFEFDIPVFGYYTDGEERDEGIQPDVFVDQNPQDIGNNVDRELNKVREIINGK